MPFLTELDERAKVKGSRDPLGLIPIWSTIGREVVGNLTTATGSVRGFTTLLLGLEFAHMLREQMRSDASDVIDTFLRFEQLAGYARIKCHGDREVRGFRRISRRLNENPRIRVSSRVEDQILSNQKIYGLWGLFTVPARSSGLLLAEKSQLTGDARTFVEGHYFPLLGNGRGVATFLNVLRRESYELHPDGKDAAILDSIGRIHSRQLRGAEKTFYRDHIAWGGPNDSTHGRQRSVAHLLAGVNTQVFGFPQFREVRKKARNHETLARSLHKIGHLERLIAPAAIIFAFLQGRDGQTTSSVARQIRETWRRPLQLDLSALGELSPSIAAASRSQPEAQLWIDLAQALSTADYVHVLELLVAINASVMQRRHSAAAWVSIDAGRVRVRMAYDRADLPSIQAAENAWRNTYFINSLWRVAREVAT